MSAIPVCLHGGPKDGEVAAAPAELVERGLVVAVRDPVKFDPRNPYTSVSFSQVHYVPVAVGGWPRRQFALCPVHLDHVPMVTRG